MTARIILADDELNLRRVLAAILTRQGYRVLEAKDGLEALALVGPEVVALITDLKMPRMDGMALLRRMSVEHAEIPVIMITAHGSVDSAVEAVKLGAFDYIEKPFEQSQIREVVDKAVRTHARSAENARPSAPPEDLGRFGLVGRSASLEQVYAVIEKVADTPSTVLITGESGTGKELVARALHAHSSRRDAPFIRINCAAIPKTLIESELFGYDKGAFTGASTNKPGRFELADTGTLFLDEIGEIPVEMQVKLLRVLQESEFERIGGIKTLKVDVRLVAATNRDLHKEVASGNFREDLFYRLNVVPLHLPPLRDRKEDIPVLVSHFVTRFNERLKKHVSSVAPQALERLVRHGWPGNIRELENVLERGILFAEGPTLTANDLPKDLGVAPQAKDLGVAPQAKDLGVAPQAKGLGVAPQAKDLGVAPQAKGLGVAPTANDLRVAPQGAVPAAMPVAIPVSETGPVVEAQPEAPPAAESLKELVRRETERVEREVIRQALDEMGGNVTQAARRLQISRKSLQMKMKELGLRDREQ
ncbi:MAG: sigma-54 dependent transcriptional regulator [Polyangia bacterium]